jgi:hypothetical protein
MFLNDFPVPEPVSAIPMVFECENNKCILLRKFGTKVAYQIVRTMTFTNYAIHT